MGKTTVPEPVLVDGAMIRAAAARIADVVWRTPLVDAPALGRVAGVPLRLKCEQLQPVGAFKLRGAMAALTALTPDQRARGVVTHSSGNHGLAVAFAARRLGVRAVVVMPEGSARVKVDGVRQSGGEVVLVATAGEREPRAQALAAGEGLTLIPPYDSAEVIAGQGTCALEILQAWPEVDVLVAPVGGGGLLAGTAAAAAALAPWVEVVGVEPALVPKLSAALAAGRPVTVPRAASLADGLLPPTLGALPFGQLVGRVGEAIAVTDEELARAVRFLWETMGLRVEPSGAAAPAAILSGRWRPRGPTAAILSGGNVDPEFFEALTAPR